MIAATKILSFLGALRQLKIERHEISQPSFNTLRRSVRNLVETLLVDTDEDAHEAARVLRAKLSELLTAPASFDGTVTQTIQSALGSVSGVQRRWGVDMARLYQEAVDASTAMAEEGSNLELLVGKALGELVTTNEDFRIYCHRASRQHFESLFPDDVSEAIRSSVFIHSAAEYRGSEIFDTLLKVGPLRAAGWGSIPDAAITAPRFGRFLQYVWAGCADEDGFGYDPIGQWSDANTGLGKLSPTQSSGVLKIVSVTRHGNSGDADGFAPEPFDELKALAEADQPTEQRAAILVQIDSGHGILYPAQATVLSLDPSSDDDDAIARRPVGSLECGRMLLMRIAVRNDHSAEVQAEHATYGKIWKRRLADLWNEDPKALVEGLFDEGVHLVNLDAGVRHWIKAPTTVVHAPQKRKHFRILMKYLGLHDKAPGVALRDRRLFWEVAWEEIGRSRGEAIQAGVTDHETAEKQLTEYLNRQLNELRELAQMQEDFTVPMRGDGALDGHVQLLPIVAVEDGFLAPDQELRTVRDLGTLNQWRV